MLAQPHTRQATIEVIMICDFMGVNSAIVSPDDSEGEFALSAFPVLRNILQSSRTAIVLEIGATLIPL